MMPEGLSEIGQELWRRGNQIMPCDLPLGVYLVLPDGQFIRCNDGLLKILRLPPESDIRKYNIADFYRNPAQRASLISRLTARETGGFLEGEEIAFAVAGHKFWVRDTCRREFREGTKELLGYFGYLTDATDEVTLRNQFDQLPAGVYRLDSDENITFVNAAVANMLGYSDVAQLIGKSVAEAYVDASQAKEMRGRVESDGTAKDVVVDLKRTDGTPVTVSISSSAIIDHGLYTGREGIIVDVTMQTRYRELLDAIPVGTYEVRYANGDEPVTECNDAFAVILGFEHSGQMKDKNIVDFYQQPADHDKFLDEMRQCDERGVPLIGFELKARKADGTPITLEVNARFIRDKGGHITGRAGVVRDITDETALCDLRDDIGRTLHVYTSTMMMAALALEASIKGLSRQPIQHEVVTSLPRADAIMDQVAQSLFLALNQLLGAGDHRAARTIALPKEGVALLGRCQETLREYQKAIPFRQIRVTTLRSVAEKVLDVLAGASHLLGSDDLAEKIEVTIGAAQELERLCCLLSLWPVVDRLAEMDYQVRALREFVILHRRIPESMREMPVASLVLKAIENVQEYANWRGIDIRFTREVREGMVMVREKQVVRAIGNLLHNAVKYSWTKPDERPSVRVRARVVGSQAWIEVNNYGVPITKEEINEDLVFQVGYRGLMSGERGRTGTGVGLADARQVAYGHRGEVVIRSESASRVAQRAGDYSGPFITTAIIKLPLHRMSEEQNEQG
jgi:PAS domain S-box-containing protein